MASTGPRSPEGKQRVSQNARKQGFRSQHVTLTAQQLAGIDACIQFFTADFPHLHQQHLALFIQLGTAWWNLQQFDKLENECYKTTDYEYAVGRLFTLTRYRAHQERLFNQAMGILLTLLAKCTIKANPPEPAPAHHNSHHGTSTVMERPHPGTGHFCTIKAKELPETILRIHRRTSRNAELALTPGIGANWAILSVIHTVMPKPFPSKSGRRTMDSLMMAASGKPGRPYSPTRTSPT